MISGVLKFLDASTPRKYNIPRTTTAAALDGFCRSKETRLLAIVNPSGVARPTNIGIFSMNITSIARTRAGPTVMSAIGNAVFFFFSFYRCRIAPEDRFCYLEVP
jgi:hypothetical protein